MHGTHNTGGTHCKTGNMVFDLTVQRHFWAGSMHALRAELRHFFRPFVLHNTRHLVCRPTDLRSFLVPAWKLLRAIHSGLGVHMLVACGTDSGYSSQLMMKAGARRRLCTTGSGNVCGDRLTDIHEFASGTHLTNMTLLSLRHPLDIITFNDRPEIRL
jgi:hypothetical protein